MSRLVHSFLGFRRRMQISKTPLFLFIEGYRDRYFYYKLVDSECHNFKTNYEIVTGEELFKGNGGGKQILLDFHDLLESLGSLIDHFEGKKTGSIFFLDKDIDDFLMKKRNSEFIIYTQCFQMENYLFIYGDIAEAAAAVSSLDTRSIKAQIGNLMEWRKRSAEHWKEWAKICLYAETRKLCSYPYYRKTISQIHQGIYGHIDDGKYNHYLAYFCRKSRLSKEQFCIIYKFFSLMVEIIYDLDQYDLIFKGKWYLYFLAEEVRRAAGLRRINFRRLEERLFDGIMQSIDFNDQWAEYYKKSIRAFLGKYKFNT